MTRTWTGVVQEQEEFRLDIRFSQDVTGFEVDDIQVFGATPDPDSFGPTTGPSRRYFVTMDTWPNYDNLVIVTIDGNVAENDDDEGNMAESYEFYADTRAPVADDAEVDGRELVVTFDEGSRREHHPAGRQL